MRHRIGWSVTIVLIVVAVVVTQSNLRIGTWKLNVAI